MFKIKVNRGLGFESLEDTFETFDEAYQFILSDVERIQGNLRMGGCPEVKSECDYKVYSLNSKGNIKKLEKYFVAIFNAFKVFSMC